MFWGSHVSAVKDKDSGAKRLGSSDFSYRNPFRYSKHRCDLCSKWQL